jgi:hypothetical protein
MTVAVPPGDNMPAPVAGSGGVLSEELTGRPPVSGDPPLSGTAMPLRVTEPATYVVFEGTRSVKTAFVAGVAPELLTVIV